MNTTNVPRTAADLPLAPTVCRRVPTRAYARIAELTAVLVSTDDFDTFRIHVLNRLAHSGATDRARIEKLVRLVWRGRDLLLSAVDHVLRATSDLLLTPTADDVVVERTSPRSGREEFEEELARDNAVAAALLAAPAWIDAVARRDPPWGRDLVNVVAALDNARTPGGWFRGLRRVVMLQHARWFGSRLA